MGKRFGGGHLHLHLSSQYLSNIAEIFLGVSGSALAGVSVTPSRISGIRQDMDEIKGKFGEFPDNIKEGFKSVKKDIGEPREDIEKK